MSIKLKQVKLNLCRMAITFLAFTHLYIIKNKLIKNN